MHDADSKHFEAVNDKESDVPERSDYRMRLRAAWRALRATQPSTSPFDKLMALSNAEELRPGIAESKSTNPKSTIHNLKSKSADSSADPAWTTLSGFPVWQNAGSIWRNYGARDLENAYRTHSLVMACIRAITTSVSEPPLRVVAPANAGRREGPVQGHPALDLLNAPNGFYSRNDVLQYWVARLLLTGTGYLWKWRNRNGRTLELWPIPTSWVNPVEGEGDALIAHYEIRQLGGAPAQVPVGDMVRLALVDPSSMTEGCAPLQAAQHDYQLDVERQNYLVEMLTNMHVPGIQVKTPGKLTQAQKDDMRAALADRIGHGRRGSPLLLEGGAEVEMVAPLADMDWPGLTGLSEARICSAFGVPPILVGARIGLERSTFSNYAEARRSFYADTLKPMWAALSGALTHGLLRMEGDERVAIEFDLTQIAELQEDMTSRATRVREDWKAGLITRNEARAEVGRRPAPDGDVYIYGSSQHSAISSQRAAVSSQ